MAGTGKRMFQWLGLVEPDEDEENEELAPTGQTSPRGAVPVRAVSADDPERRRREPGPEHQEAIVRPLSPQLSGRVHVITPTGFNDAEEIGERLKSNYAVIMNLQAMEHALYRRLTDFASGLTFGLNGRMQRVADRVYLLTPEGVEVSAEARRVLEERGLFNQD